MSELKQVQLVIIICGLLWAAVMWTHEQVQITARNDIKTLTTEDK